VNLPRPGESIGGYRPKGLRPKGKVQEHRGRAFQRCLMPGCGGQVETYATDLASCQACGADYFVRRRKGRWMLQLIKKGRAQK